VGKYTTKECYECNIRRPAHQMSQKVIEVKSGKSGISVSFNPQRKQSLRVNSGRNYYRKKTIWVCKDSRAHGNVSYFEELEKQKQELEKQQKTQREIEQFANELEQQITEAFCEWLPKKSVDRVFEVLSMDKQFITKSNEVFEELSSKLGDKLLAKSPTDLVKRIISSSPILFKDREVSFKNFKKHTEEYAQVILPNLATVPPLPEGSTKALKNRKILLWIAFLTIPAFLSLGIPEWLFASIPVWMIVKFFYKRAEVSAFKNMLKFSSSIFKKTKDIHGHKFINKSKPILNRLVLDELMSNKSLSSNKHFTSAFEELFGKTPYEQKEATTIDIVNSISGSRTDRRVTKQFIESEDFLSIASYALAMTVAEADGEFSKEEQDYIEKNLDLSRGALNVFKYLAKLSDRNKTIIAAVYTMHHDDPDLLLEVIRNLFVLADADGEVTADEIRSIKSIADGLFVSTVKFNRVKKEFVS
jgi:tellurite resistance protein